MPHAVRWRGPLDRDLLERALRELLARHEVLRARFEIEDGSPVQRIGPVADWRLAVLDAGDSERDLLRSANDVAAQPFDLARGPLFRATLLRRTADDHMLVLVMHHAITDGWSIRILHRELVALYRAFAAGEPSPLTPNRLTYLDYAAWQRRLLDTGHHDAELAYWKRELADAPVLELPTDRPRPALQTYRGASHVVEISVATSSGLTALARTENVTLPIALLGSFAVLLGRYAGQSDVLVGTPVANRTHADLEPLVGFFINMLPIRIALDTRPTTRALFKIARDRILAAQEHGKVPFDRVVDHLKPARDRSRHPVFQAGFRVNEPVDRDAPPGVELSQLELDLNVAKYDLNLSIDLIDGRIHCTFDFNVDLFERDTVERIGAAFGTLLDAMVAQPDRRVHELPLVAGSDRDLQQRETIDAPDACVHELFEAYARSQPDAVAVVCESVQRTYAELDREATRLAHRLIEHGVGRDVIVGLHIERSVEFIVAMLAVLKAGGAYLPLDPELPDDRLAYMASDAGAKVVVSAVQHELAGPWITVRLGDAIADASKPIPLRGRARPTDLVYVLYTSGSTGRPKGVLVEHRNLVNYVAGVSRRFQLVPGTSYATVTTLSGDLGNTAIFPAQCCGGTLHLIAWDRATSAARLGEYFARHRVDVVKAVPSLVAALLDSDDPAAVLPRRMLVVGGEALPWALVDRLRALAPSCEVFNHYGPTETTVGSLTNRTDGARRGANVPIGHALPNQLALVLDQNGDICPIGVVGEIYIGGAGVTRGYVGRPELTAERFVPDPLSPGAKLYRTGDRARRLPDGSVEFLGRVDTQVKIRGYRIEPDEVANLIRKQPGVAQAVVVARELSPGGLRLVAYVVSAADRELSLDALRNELAAKLPDYMVPAAFVRLDALPLTPNGKLDRAALPAPELRDVGAAYVAPRDDTERTLAELWQELLGIARVGVDDDFFALGGHSLLATRLVSRIRSRLGIEVAVRAVFDAPTIAGLAGELALRTGREAPAVHVQARPERPPLSFAQHRLWFLHQLEPDSPTYLVSHARRYEHLDVESMRRAFEALVERHEILRTSFPAIDGEPYQRVHPPARWTLSIEDASGLDDAGQAAVLARVDAERRRPFDLDTAPPLRTHVVRVGSDAHVVFVTLHHIITDGGSFDIFWRELWSFYDAFAAGSSPPALPPLPLQYADFAVWQRASLAGPELARQLAFWTERLHGAPEETQLPFKGPRPPRQTFRGREHVVTLDEDRTAALRALGQQNGATLFMTLAAAFRALLVRYCGQPDILLGTAINNRTLPDVEGLIGMFADTLVLRTELRSDDTFATLLAREKAGALASFEHQHAPFELVVDALGVERSLSRPPLVQVMYVHQGEVVAPDRGAPVRTGQPPSAEFDLTLISWDHGEHLVFHFLFNDDLLETALVEQLGRHFQRLLDGVVADSRQPLVSIDLLDDVDHARLHRWGTNERTDDAPFLLDLIDEHVARTPDAIAVVHGDVQLTYRDLAARTRRVAGWLADRGVARGDRVAICVERSADMVAAVLGVLYVGAAYVPIDPEYPAARRELMRRDTASAVEITDDSLRETLVSTRETDRCAVTGSDIAYFIYTSGSTGMPKGVRVPHGAIANYMLAMRGAHGVTASDTVVAISSLSFDAHVIDILMPLARGARTVIADRDTTRDGEKLARLLESQAITFIFSTPATYRALLATGWRPSPRLRIHCGGEAWGSELANQLLATAGALWNVYGPTETTVYATYMPLAPGEPLTIGRPLANLSTYVLDDALRPTPVGVAGELYIGGRGVTLGYHNRPELSAERFVPDPFATEPGARMYRSGDRVRWTQAGTLEYVARVDGQVKLRGLRIELGEIEAALRAHAGVADVVVLLREDMPGNPQLVAYLVPVAADASPDATELRALLKASLPDYMVPTAFISLAVLPVTSNGKLDRKALPVPDVAASSTYVAPRDPTEEAIARTWRDILGVERVGAHDDFFALGGHSLLATRVTSRIRSELDVELPVRSLFETPTVAGLATRVAALRATAAGVALPPVRAMPLPDRPPLSYAQQRLWFLHALDPDSPAYVITRAREIRDLDVEALRGAFDALIARHASLRTSFPAIAGEPYQQVAPAGAWTLPLEDARALDASEQAALLARIEREQRRPFDLAAGPLIRTNLVICADDRHVLFVTLHHIVTDGWSEGVMWRELWAAYDALAAGRAIELPSLPIQYADYAAWQRRWLAGPELTRQLDFWTQRLAGAPEQIELPFKGPRPPRQTFKGRGLSVHLDSDLASRIRDLARRERASLFMVFAASLRALLARYSGQSDVVLGTAIANRNIAELEGLIGMFVNTLVLRNELRVDDTFAQLLARERSLALAAYDHQHTPFELVVDALGIERSLTRTPLFQVMYVHQEAGDDPRGTPLDLGRRTAMFDLAVDSWDRGGELGFDLVYNEDLFDPWLVEQLAHHFERLLDAFARDPHCALARIELLTAHERQALVGGGETTVDYGREPLLPGLIAAQVDRSPDALAVTFERTSITYRELDERTNRLAHALIAAGAVPDRPIAVSLERSIELIVSVLAVIKAGAAYLPIDPSTPPLRARSMLDDSGCALVIDRAWLAAMAKDIAARPATRPAVTVRAQQAAYVLFTSGSTGAPKGAVIAHDSIRNRLLWAHTLGFASSDVLLHKTPISFDVSVFELFYPFIVGARLVVARPDGHRDPDYLIRLIRDERVTYAHFVPSMFGPFLEAVANAPCPSLRRVICSGEALSAELVRDAARVLDVELYNLYGPTEATVDVSWWHCVPDARRASVPIGVPVSNTRLYVLDRERQLVPYGVAGELYIGGIQLGRGYSGRPDLTAERFVPDPFCRGERMYRTGDLARVQRDGAIEYLGRIDHQIKLRGFRIELGEIEAALRQSSRVTDAAVLLREDIPGRAQLVAYVVTTGELDVDALRAHVASLLPEYMVPTAFVALPALPVTANGKLDRKALPAPDVSSVAAYVEPRGEIETTIASIWRELLVVDRVGAHDDFFSLGGHSLLAIRMIAQLRIRLAVEVPVRVVFDAPRLADLANRVSLLRGGEPTDLPPLVAGPRNTHPTLSFAQERLWFLHQLDPDSPAYVIGYARRYDRLDVESMRRALEALVERHEILRTTFPAVDGQPYQRVHAPARWELSVEDGAGETVLARVDAEMRRPFDLANGPLFRTRIVRVGPDAHVMFVALHHIITDGGSFDIFWRELWSLYDALASGRSPSLPPLPVQYADYAAWQRTWLAGGELERQLAFWTDRLRGAPEETPLPFKGPRPPRQTFTGRAHTLTFDAAHTAAIRTLAQRHGATLFMTMAAAFRALLVRYTGQADVLLGTAINNRTVAALEGVIGMFANTLVLRTEVRPDDTFATLLAREKTGALSAYDHQHTPFELIVDALDVERSLSRPPVVQVMYIHQGEAVAHDRGIPVQTGRAPSAELDAVLQSWERDNQLVLQLTYNDDLFDAALIAQLMNHFARLVASVTSTPEGRLAAIDLLDEAEHAQLRAWNDTARSNDDPQTLHALIDRQVARTPDTIAVEHDGFQISYRELAQRSENVAGWLAARGVKRGDRVALCVERCADMVTAMIGVLRLGAAYVPIDPEYPARRREHMRVDAGAVIEVTDETLRDAIASTSAAPRVVVDPEDIAYVIYTSGSTGLPKGVRLPHRAVANFLRAMLDAPGVRPNEVTLGLASISFDASVLDLYVPLVAGATLVVASRELARDGLRLARFIEERGVTYMQATPSTWRMLVSTDWRPSPRLRVLTGGEATTADLVNVLAATSESVWNLYGPTETAVYSTRTQLHARGAVTVGRPLDNTAIYILDEAQQRTPIGVAGELHIGGRGVALGYHQRPELTAQRFIADPFSDVPGARMYRTGDRARWTRDGTIEYLGRIDTQIKLRGFRIELGEIEAALRAAARVEDAAVLVREDTPGNPQLVAYVVSSDPALDTATLKAELAGSLPDYMVPTAFVVLEALPLNPSGKLDRKALPAPELTSGAAYVAPRDATEAGLVEIWRGILGIEQLGVHDDFFALGGHSLLATRLISQIRGQLAVELPVRAVFEAPTVAGLAQRIAEHRATGAAPTATVPLVAVARGDRPPLSFAQERMWFLHQLEPDSPAYLIGHARRFDALDVDALGRAFTALVARHESLRTTFPDVDGVPYQRVHPASPWTIPIEDVRTLDAAARADVLARVEAEQQHGFDLTAGPLLRTNLVRTSDTGYVLFVKLHHIITDGWSQDVLWRELWTYYDAFVAQQPTPALAAMPLQYADYAAWQRSYLAGGELERQLAFWTERLQGAPEETRLPFKRSRPAELASRRVREVEARIPADVADNLRRLSQREGATLFMTLLAGFRALLARATSETDLVIGTPIANRNHREIEGLIGFFVNTLALRGEVRPDEPFSSLLAREKATALAAYDHQDAPFELVVDALHVTRRLDITPLFQVWFVHQNIPRDARVHGEYVAPSGAENTSKFDLALYSLEDGDAIRCAWHYNADLFDEATIAQLVADYETLLAEVAARPAQRVDALLPAAIENQQVATATATTLWDRFTQVVAARPDHIAVHAGAARLTYAELHARAEAIAAHLDAADAGERVACLLEHGPDMVAGVLGVLAGGRAYVPLDSTHPVDRSAFVLRDSGARTLLCDAEHAELAASLGETMRIVRMDEAASGGAPRQRPRPHDLAYCLYTSGSTGRPKGVLQRHAHVVNLLDGYSGRLGVVPADVVTLLSTFAFDAAVVDLFSTLLAGATLCPYSLRAHGLTDLPAMLVERGVTIYHSTPTVWREVVALAPALSTKIRAVVLGGEEVRPDDVVAVRTACSPKTVLVNGYGMTECSWALLNVVEASSAIERNTVALGSSIPGVRVVLDTAFGAQRIPFGTGTIRIESPYVALGYHERPAETAVAFPAPATYVTSDLGRLLPSGQIEFAGRHAHQIKLRGFRIDLREIEGVLASHPDVYKAAVAVHDGARGPELVGYVVAREGQEVDATEVRLFLATQLPDYMIPAVVMPLAVLPLGPTGKLDRSALPAPDATAFSHGDHVAPRNAVEQALADIWSELLGVDDVGVHDDFFELGGHSLLAMRVLAHVRRRFEMDLSVRVFFDSPTIEGLAREIAPRQTLERTVVARSERPPLSFGQQRLWFLHQLEPATTAYILETVTHHVGIDVEILRRAFEAVVARHEILRTTFPAVDGEPYQHVNPSAPWVLPIEDARTLDATGQAATLARIADEQHLPFDLERGPLLRTRVVLVGDDALVLHVTLHHMLIDADSLTQLSRELWDCYAALAGGRTVDLPPLPQQYVDYAAWERAWMSGAELERQLSYWTATLRGAPETIALPLKASRPLRQTYDGRTLTVALPAPLTSTLRSLAREHGATMFMVIAAAFRAVLARYSGQRDVLFGTALNQRASADYDAVVGMYAKPIVLRNEIRVDDTFASLVSREKDGAFAAYDHQHTPFELILDALGAERNPNRNPLFQVLYVHKGEVAAAPELASTTTTATLDLTLTSSEHAGQLFLQLFYNIDLFDHSLIEQFGRHLGRFIEVAASDARRPLTTIDLLDDLERRRLLEWGSHARAGERPLVLSLFKQHVARTPDAVAVVHGDVRLTYRELASRSERVASWLAAKGVKRGDRVTLCMERWADVVAAMLGVLQVGAAYVPIDPEYPAARRELIVRDTGAVVELDDVSVREALTSRSHVRHCDVGGSDVAYIIYTSGSTGTPKGVCVPHSALANYLAAMQGPHGVTASDVVAAIASFSFDAHVIDIWLPLANGAQVAMADRDTTRDGERLAKLLVERDVTFMFATPTTLRAMLAAGWVPSPRLRVQCGGEAWGTDLAAQLLPHASAVWNGYGPTETTVYATCGRVHAGQPIMLSRPLPNVRAYVLDDALLPTPVGVAGELYIAGDSVTLGYHDRPTLTAERFVPDALAATAGSRMYRSGDRVRWTRDGQLEYLERIDKQVKLRGLRIELGEIEAAIRTHAHVNDVVVVLRDDLAGGEQLVAYVASDAGDAFDSAALRGSLRASLPSYMIPSAIVTLVALPLTTSGKLDRKALPAPERAATDAYVAPRDSTERTLAAIWCELLGVERASIDDDFFQLGGQSLLAMRVLAYVRQRFDVELSARAFFDMPTIAGLAAVIAQQRAQRQTLVAPPRGERPPLSFTQHRLWFLQALEPDSAAYVIHDGRELERLDVEALRAAFEALVARHEPLRTTFPAVDGEPYQLVHPPQPFALPIEDARHLDADGQASVIARVQAHQQRPFDLARGPLLRVDLVRVGADAYTLLITLHHIISDGWSQAVLWRELWAFYDAFAAGRPAPALPALPIQYADYAAWQRARLAGAELERQLAFWTTRLADAPAETALPLQVARPARATSRARTARSRVEPDVATTLRALAQRQNTSEFMVLLAAFRALLARATGQGDLVVGTPIANRNQQEVENLIGFFVNTLALRSEVLPDEPFASLLARERDNALAAYDHQDTPFELIVDALHLSRRLDITPLFQVWFVHQNFAPDAPEVAGDAVIVPRAATRETEATSKFDLSVYSTDDGSAIQFAWQYNADLFDEKTILQLIADYHALLAQIAARPDLSVADLLSALDVIG